ncbi:hypothetical protein GGQ94_002203 [Petrimonas sulfuriphila]|jgi:hypothetical protein|nr:hypothetical protein [Porphyromonadaceae bacterium]
MKSENQESFPVVFHLHNFSDSVFKTLIINYIKFLLYIVGCFLNTLLLHKGVINSVEMFTGY